jgi:hypothetical protein
MGFIQSQQDELHARMEGREDRRTDDQPVDTSLPDDQAPEGYEEQHEPQQ